MPKVRETLQEIARSPRALDENAAKAGKLAEFLRRKGLRYSDIAAMAEKYGISGEDWEALLLESESA